MVLLSSTLILMWFLWIFHLSLLSSPHFSVVWCSSHHPYQEMWLQFPQVTISTAPLLRNGLYEKHGRNFQVRASMQIGPRLLAPKECRQTLFRPFTALPFCCC